MISEISKSSFDAALFIIKNNKIIKEKKEFSDYYYSSVDYDGGNELVKGLGRKILDDYTREINLEKKKRILRIIILNFFKVNKPPSLNYLPSGPKHFLDDHLSSNFAQIFEEAGLNVDIESNKEVPEEVIKWWDDLSQFARSLIQDKKLESGRIGEEKTYKYEKKKLKDMGIKSLPKKMGFWDNKLGYDVKSWDKNLNEIYIEAKSSAQSNGEFYFTKNAWVCAMAEKERYYVHIWIQNHPFPRIMEFEELKKHVQKYHDISGSGDHWDKIKIIPKGKN